MSDVTALKCLGSLLEDVGTVRQDKPGAQEGGGPRGHGGSAAGRDR